MQELLERKPVFVPKARSQIFLRKSESNLPRARITVAPRPQRNALFVRQPLHQVAVNESAIGIEEIDLDGPTAPISVRGAIQTDHRAAITVTERQQSVNEPTGQTHDPGMNQVNPNPLNQLEANFYGG